MNRMLKNSLLGTAVLMLFFLTAAHPGLAGEVVPVPLLPMTVEGVALIDGDPAPTGTVVAAYLNGTQVKEFLVNTSSGDFKFWISGTAEDEGKPVTFTVDGKDSGKSFDWESGKQVSSLELSVGVVADSGSSKKSSTSSTSSGSSETNESKASGAEVIESSVPQQNVTVQEKTVPENTVADSGEDAGAEQSAESSEESSETSSAPGFQIISAVAGLILLTFGSKLGGARRKP